MRNESLATGSLLVLPPSGATPRTHSLLLLVEGAADIRALRDIEVACAPIVGRELKWHTVANQRDLATISPRPDPSRITRVEVAELRGLSVEVLRQLLAPALLLLQQGQPCFPSATRTEGSVVHGVDFLGRDSELTTLREFVMSGQHVLLAAPRRSGKTSLLRRFAQQNTSELNTVFVDVESFQSAEAFTTELVARSRGQVFTTETLKQVRVRGWKAALREAIHTLASGSRPLVLILDELVFFIDNLRRTPEDLLAVLSTLDGALSETGARLVVAGSMPLEQLSGDLNLGRLPGAFGALRRYALPPLAHDRLDLDLRRVLLGTGLVAEKGDMEWLLRHVDLSMPYPALRFVAHLASSAYERPLSIATLETELEAFLSRTGAFTELLGQLRQEAQTSLSTAQDIESILDRLSRLDSAMDAADVRGLLGGSEEAQAQRFAWLMEHFPLTLDGHRVRIASRLFQQFWRIHRGLTP
nr:ATP-binding protein [Myxococcus sp. CA040A]